MTEARLMTRAWSELSAHFRHPEEVACTAIAELCDYIEARPIRSGVHGWQSMYTLCVVQIPVAYPYEGPRLQIEPRSNGSVEFRYVDTYIQKRMWTRVEPADRVIERFRKTMIQLGWFTDRTTLD